MMLTITRFGIAQRKAEGGSSPNCASYTVDGRFFQLGKLRIFASGPQDTARAAAGETGGHLQ